MQITNDWLSVFEPEFAKPYYETLYAFVNAEYRNNIVYPPMDELFTAFHETPLASVKVVILGQDPYHGSGQAHGLSFSVKPGIEPPPSLQNIYKELQAEFGCYIPNNGYLMPWAKQGVLMLNTCLTVREGQPGSHQNMGWEEFTDAAIRAVDALPRPVVFMLWGAKAQAKRGMLQNPYHLVLQTSHPSPFSANRGFLGCGHFRQANEYLMQNGVAPINWQIPNI